MAIDQALVSFKKLFNKPNTSPEKKLLANEGDSVGFSADTSHIFGKKPPVNVSGSFYSISGDGGTVERVRLPLVFIAGTDSSEGRHGFQAKLPSDYETSSSNPRAGAGFWKNNQIIVNTTGSIQLVSEFSGGPAYKPILRDKNLNQIPALDPREWITYEFGGIIYQETPPGPGDINQNPGFLDCYLYIGPMANELIASASLKETGSNNIAFESQGIELTSAAAKVNFTGSGVSGTVTTGSNGDIITYTIPEKTETTSSVDYKQILFLADQGPFDNFNFSEMFHSVSYEAGTPFISSSVWYTDISQSGKIFEIEYGIRNSLKQAEEIIYRVYEDDGVTIKKEMKDIVTYSGPIEIGRKRITI